jgi:hypothetical protein
VNDESFLRLNASENLGKKRMRSDELIFMEIFFFCCGCAWAEVNRAELCVYSILVASSFCFVSLDTSLISPSQSEGEGSSTSAGIPSNSNPNAEINVGRKREKWIKKRQSKQVRPIRLGNPWEAIQEHPSIFIH